LRTRVLALALAVIGGANPASWAQTPFGLDSREPIGPYLNGIMPSKNGAFAFPPVLSATGAFTDLRTLSPAQGLIPFTVNSPLWSDGAIKTRWMAVPNDGPPYTATEQIAFSPASEWSFPNGTVFVKNFELVANEITGERRRLETRFLVRDANGEVYGVTYKWRADNSDADLLPASGLDENINVTDRSGAVRIQKWSYPSRGDCLFCHNPAAGYVLGLKTHQLNGDFRYLATGRTDNQLRTLAHLGMLNPAPAESELATLPRAVAVTDPSATIEHRMKSWLDANCSLCHRPNGFCPQFDARLATPLKQQNLIGAYLKFRDAAGSELYQRDNSLGPIKMPPLAKNVVHEDAMATLRQWMASPLEVLSVNLYQDGSHLLVRFNSNVDLATATTASNYTLDNAATVATAMAGPQPDNVILTVSPLNAGQTYVLKMNSVRDTAPSANTIWPDSALPFVAAFSPEPAPHRLANLSSRQRVADGNGVAIAGFIARGSSPKRVLIRAVGPSLEANGLGAWLNDPMLELHDNTGALIASNNDWMDNYNRQEISDTGLAPPDPREASILVRLPVNEAGLSYTAVLRGAAGESGVSLLEVYDLDRGLGSTLVNEASRGLVGTGDEVLIAGTIVLGSQSQKVIVRAIGPSLPIPGKLRNPTLELRDANGGLVEANDNWIDSPNKQAIIDSTIPPGSDLESAIVRMLTPAAYTAIVRGVNNTTGIAVVEVYALQ
jgi:hypothetical protein